PKDQQTIGEGLPGELSRKILAQQCQFPLDLWAGAIFGRRSPHRQRRQRGPKVLGPGFPWRQLELKPAPGPSQVPLRQLLGPHVIEGKPRISGEGAGERIVSREDERIENGLGSARLSRPALPVVRANLVPEPNA